MSNVLDWLSFGTGALGSLSSLFTANSSWKKQVRFQKEQMKAAQDFNAEQARLSRQFNHDEAALARQYNTDMFHMTNDYNTPEASLQRLRDAGLNPDLYYSGSDGGIASSSSSPAASSSPASAPALGSPSFSPVDFSGISQSPLIAAQAELLRAQAAKTNVETGLLEIDEKYRDKTNLLQVENLEATRDWTKAQRNVAIKSIDELDAKINQLKSQSDLIFEQENSVRTENILKQLETFVFENVHGIYFDSDGHLQTTPKFRASAGSAAVGFVLDNVLKSAQSNEHIQHSKLYKELTKTQEFLTHISQNDANVSDFQSGLDILRINADKDFVKFDKYVNEATDVIDAAFSVFNLKNAIKGGNRTSTLPRHRITAP